jgi:uncharacterized protein YcfJ
MIRRTRLLTAAAALGLAACATVPPGPSVQALPGSRKTFDQFQFDDASCRDFAVSQTGSASDAANSAGAGSAVVGTAIGAIIGGLIGGGDGAAVGAGMGLLTGAAAGTGYAQGAYVTTQRRYDSIYLQCMYAKGNKVPVPGGYADASRPRPVATAPGYAPPPNAAIPPPGTPPPNAAIPPPGTPAPYQLPR